MDNMLHEFPTRRNYIVPEIAIIRLDNEISLALESVPPVFPGEGYMKAPDYFIRDPFRANLS